MHITRCADKILSHSSTTTLTHFPMYEIKKPLYIRMVVQAECNYIEKIRLKDTMFFYFFARKKVVSFLTMLTKIILLSSHTRLAGLNYHGTYYRNFKLTSKVKLSYDFTLSKVFWSLFKLLNRFTVFSISICSVIQWLIDKFAESIFKV